MENKMDYKKELLKDFLKWFDGGLNYLRDNNKLIEEYLAESESIPIEPQVKKPNGNKINSQSILYSVGNNDECYTPAYAVTPLLEFLPKGKIYWLPFDKNDSNFVRVLANSGHNIINTHIEYGQDFYIYEPKEWDVIVSNPPYTNKRKIFERAISFGKPFALLMSNTWLNDSAPKQLFANVDLQLLMFEGRIKFLSNGVVDNKITFSSSYFCYNLLPKQIIMRSF